MPATKQTPRTATPWFNVDKEGLSQLKANESKAFVINELVSNAWDQNVTGVTVSLKYLPNPDRVEVRVEDDDPEGFADLRDAFTLFASSRKKTDATKRGRFNFGEKLVLAIAKEARITTTTGTLVFDELGRHERPEKRARGSEFWAIIPATTREIAEMKVGAKRLLPPVPTIVDGELLPQPEPLGEFEATLPTVIADTNGNLTRATSRKTTVRVYEPLEGHGQAWLYELGVPVVKLGDDTYSVNVEQKIPLNFDRDNVNPSFLSHLRTAVLNNMYASLDMMEIQRPWVNDALASPRVDTEAVSSVMKRRFGENAVIFDPSDLEANNRAVAAGRTVIRGGHFSKDIWENVRRAETFLPAGEVTPGRANDQDLGPSIPQGKWSAGMLQMTEYSKVIARELLGAGIEVEFKNHSTTDTLADYRPGHLRYNVGRLGYAFFDKGASVPFNDLLIHELAHHLESNHLDDKYYNALTLLGARMVKLALDKPHLFKLPAVPPVS